jgi:Zn-dependent protease with chaperone function
MIELLTRRTVMAGLGCACCGGFGGLAQARISPLSMTPLVARGYKPTEKDEQGLWQQYERVEQEIAGSNLLIQDKALTGYLGDLVGRIGGPAAKDLRVYLAQVPEFNAFMAPTGFMVVFSGLLTRMRDEAQLSGVLAHESGHFLRRHHIRGWRDLKRKSNIFSIAAMGAGAVGAATGVYLGDAVQLGQLGTILSLFAYSRELEAEADAMGLKLIAQAGYDPLAMPEIWQQLIGEIEASAAMRKKRPDRGYSLFATHPAPESRMKDLRESAAEVKSATGPGDRGRDRYLTAIARQRTRLLDDQVKLNDPGASLYIIQHLARDGWNGLLRFYEAEVWRLRGEKGDAERSAQGYAAAVQYADAPPEAWRNHGYALLKLGHREDGKAALARYLAMAPKASDAAMVRYSLAQ